MGAVRVFAEEGEGEAERLRDGGLDGAAMSLVARVTSGIWDTSVMMSSCRAAFTVWSQIPFDTAQVEFRRLVVQKITTEVPRH